MDANVMGNAEEKGETISNNLNPPSGSFKRQKNVSMDRVSHIIGNNNIVSEHVSINLVTGQEITRENSKEALKRSSTAGD